MLLLAAGTVAEGGDGESPSSQLVVNLDAGGDIDAINEAYGTSTLGSIVEELLYLLLVPDNADPELLAQIFEALPIVEWAEPNIPMITMDGTTGSFFVSLNPEQYFDQYALDLVQVSAPVADDDVSVAVLDTGVDAAHPQLSGLLSPDAFDFVDGDGDPADAGDGQDTDGDGLVDELVGHGTHIAGVVALVAPNAQIMPVRVLNGDGTGYSFRVAEAIYWAVEHGARVINLSMASPVESNVMAVALEHAEQQGVVVVAAAGNLDQLDPVQHPAGHPATIAVAATDPADLKSVFSNYNAAVTISAPGTQIVGTLPDGGYGAADGTSFAAALVTGAAATLKAGSAEASPEAIVEMLTAAADPVDDLNPAYEGLLGAGRLNIAAALTQTPSTPCAAGDLDLDGTVGTLDLLTLLAAWGANPGHPADLDGNGFVDATDFLELLEAWGPC